MKIRRRTLADFQPQLDLADRRIAVDPESRRIAVRVASFGETHSGFGPQVKVPRNVNVDAAHVGVAELDDGSSLRVATLPMDTVHAPKDLAAMHAASWYENTGKSIARVRYSIDSEGIRADGILFDDVEDAQIDRITAASASGDWRAAMAIKRFEDFEHTPSDFIGSCIVNIPGFSDTFAKAAGSRLALAASAHTIISIEDEGTTVDEENDTLTAGAADSNPDGAADLAPGCSGECSSCTCGGKKIEEAPKATVTLSASALALLTSVADGSEVDPDAAALAAAKEEAVTALTAAGAIQAPDPIAELSTQVANLTNLVTALVFED